MANKKKAVPTPEDGDKETLDSLAIAAFKDLVNSVQAEFKAYLATEGEMVLGNELAYNRASIIKLNQAITTRSESYDKALKTITACRRAIEKLRKENEEKDKLVELHKASIVNLNERLLFLEKEYSNLCNKRNEDFHTLTVIGHKQREFIEKTNAKLKKRGF